MGHLFAQHTLLYVSDVQCWSPFKQSSTCRQLLFFLTPTRFSFELRTVCPACFTLHVDYNNYCIWVYAPPPVTCHQSTFNVHRKEQKIKNKKGIFPNFLTGSGEPPLCLAVASELQALGLITGRQRATREEAALWFTSCLAERLRQRHSALSSNATLASKKRKKERKRHLNVMVPPPFCLH